MAWTIYTLGDASFFAGVLNGVAMVFGSEAFRGTDGSFGGSAIFLIFLLALLTVLGSALVNQWKTGNNPTILLVLFVVWIATGYTRVDVVVEDIYTGAVESVDNVPMLVGVPASIITTATVSISKLFQTAFSTSGAYAAEMTTDGFVNPLKLLLSVRRAASYSPHLTANWAQFVRYCVVGASTPQQVMNHPEGVMGALRAPENLQPHIHTRYYMQDIPEPTMVSCEAAGPIIAADLMNYFSSVNPALNRALRDGAGRSNTATAKTWEDVTAFYANNASLSGVDAQHTSANIMFYQMTNDVFKCGNQSSDPNAYFSCTQLLSDQQQAFAVDAAAGASGMTRTMISSMGFLLALFMGLSPLVLLVALSSASNALPLLGKYLMFGVWTQSWLPAAFLINFFIIETWSKATKDMVRHFRNSIPLEAIPLFWMETADKIAVASDLLAAVPLITLAAMTGSYFALAKLGERWSGKDYSQERMVTPELAKVGAVSSNASIREHSEGAGGQTVGAARVKYNLQDSLNRNVSDREQDALRVGSEITRDWSQTGKYGGAWEKISQLVKTDNSQAGRTWANGMQFVDKLLEKVTYSDRLSDTDKSDLRAGLQFSLAASIFGSGIAGSATGDFSTSRQSIQDWVKGTDEGKEFANALKNEFSSQRYSSIQGVTTDAVRRGFSTDDIASLKKSFGDYASVTKAHEKAVQLANSVGASLNLHAGELNKRIVNDGGFGLEQIVKGIHSTLATGDDDRSREYRAAYERISAAEQSSTVGATAADSEYGWVLSALHASGHDDKVVQIASAMMGMRDVAAPTLGQFEGVGAPLVKKEDLPTVERWIKENAGALKRKPAAAAVRPQHLGYQQTVQGNGPGVVPVPVRPSNDSPTRPVDKEEFLKIRVDEGAEAVGKGVAQGAAAIAAAALVPAKEVIKAYQSAKENSPLKKEE